MSNKEEREKMVLAMEYIVRQISDEDIFYSWLYTVADGDIPYGCLDPTQTDEYGYPLDLEYYTRDKNFADLMSTFLALMSRARKSGGLYCGGIVSSNAEV